jgi:hypothetical protein
MAGLSMKTRCERCEQPLDFSSEAYICSFECTFCRSCAEKLDSVCPNCRGELLRRPRRAPANRPAEEISHH